MLRKGRGGLLKDAFQILPGIDAAELKVSKASI
jgi:hypothetical protein